MLDRGQQVPGTPGLASAAIVATAVAPSAVIPPIVAESGGGSGGAPQQRSSRRNYVQVPSASEGRGGSLTTAAFVPGYTGGMGAHALAHSASERRTGATAASNRTGHTPRPSETDRGRGSPTVHSSAKKEIRDRSLGAQPHSPRPKGREIMSGGPNSGDAPTSRRRTMPPVAAGRSTSAEERSRASWRRRSGEGEAPGSTAQKVLRGAPARDSGASLTARQRR